MISKYISDNIVALKSKTSSLHPSSTQQHVVQELEASYSSRPPSYTTNAPFEDSFGNGDAIDPNSNSMQTGLQDTTATPIDPPPAAMAAAVDPLPPMPTVDADSSALEIVLDESLPTPPPLPAQPSVLERGLQIPSRGSVITWGFSLPKILAERGVTKKEWKRFSHELKRFARMRMSQLLTVLACEVCVHNVFGPIVGQSPRPARPWTALLTLSQVASSDII